MSIPYDELAKKARGQVESLEEPYRSIAYETILQDLIREAKRNVPGERTRTKTPGSSEGVEDPVELFLTSVVDAGTYTKVFGVRGKLMEKSLAVLKLARDQLGIDGLTPPQISEILIKKFRVAKVHPQNVARDLAKATQYVHRLKAGNEYKYLLMTAGESHLEEVASGPSR
jgi:hypothetical protein